MRSWNGKKFHYGFFTRCSALVLHSLIARVPARFAFR